MKKRMKNLNTICKIETITNTPEMVYFNGNCEKNPIVGLKHG
jgi:hypothetical protein